jgi:hypothetical protein
MSKRRVRTPERYIGPPDWLEKPVPLVPGGKVLVHGCTKDAPRGLLAYWRRESERLNRPDREAA